MLFSLLKHYLDTDTALKVSQSDIVLCTVSLLLYLMVLKTISPGCGLRVSLMLFLYFVFTYIFISSIIISPINLHNLHSLCWETPYQLYIFISSVSYSDPRCFPRVWGRGISEHSNLVISFQDMPIYISSCMSVLLIVLVSNKNMHIDIKPYFYLPYRSILKYRGMRCFPG